MATIVTRSGKGSPLTNTEVDSNFTNLNTDKLELSGGTMTGNIAHTGNFTFDIAGYLDLDVDDGGSVYFSDGGVTFGRIYGTNSNLYIKSNRSEKDIIFQGVDGGTAITALTLDMSDDGTAIFNHDIQLPDNGKAIFGTGADLQIYHDGSNGYATSNTGQFFLTSSNSNIWLRGNEGGILSAD